MDLYFNTTSLANQECDTLFVWNGTHCVHKDIFPPAPQEIFTTITMCILNALGSAAGVAEAGLLTSYLVLFIKYTTAQSINAAYAVGLGGALGNFVNIVSARHPETNRPLINYEINLVIIPMLMFGASIGVTFSKILPELAIDALLFIVLFISSVKFYVNLKKQLKREKNIELEGSLLEISKQEAISSPGLLVDAEPGNYEYAEYEQITKREQRIFPWEKYREAFIIILGIVVFSLIRGSDKFKSIVGFEYCKREYWLMLGAMLVFFLIMFWRTSHLVQSWQKRREMVGMGFQSNELVFTKARILKVGGLSGFAGTIGATLAIGGAMILQPFFLAWGLPPREISYTTSFFVIFTLFNTTYQCIMSGGLGIDQAIWFGGIAFVCSFLSSKFVGNYVRKTGKQSILLKLLLFVSIFSITLEGYVSVSDIVKHGLEPLLKFHDICGTRS